MDYNNFSLEELKDIAKEKGIPVGNIGKEKLIEKIKKHDTENNTPIPNNIAESITNDIASVNEENGVNENTEMVIGTFNDEKENIVDSINNIISDLEDFEESDTRDDTIDNIGMEEEVPCMSITFGGLTYISPITGAIYNWHKIGDVEYLTMKELISMNNSKPVFLNRPWIILQDMRAVNKFKLTSKYEEVAKINQLRKLFDLGNIQLISDTIDNALLVGMRDVVISKVRTMYNNGVLNNTHIIKLLENKLKFELEVD